MPERAGAKPQLVRANSSWERTGSLNMGWPVPTNKGACAKFPINRASSLWLPRCTNSTRGNSTRNGMSTFRHYRHMPVECLVHQ